jgi:signal transduction histidine kinase
MTSSDRTADSTFDRVAIDLTHAPFPELAAAIRARIERIMKHWRDLSLKAMPHLDKLTVVEFEDTIAIILSAAADALQSENPRHLRGVIDTAGEHGVDRFVQKTSVLDLFEEVRILRNVVIIEIGDEMHRALEVEEAASFHAIFDIIIQQGVMALVKKQHQFLEQFQATTAEMNEQLLISGVRQSELLEQAKVMQETIARQGEELAAESRRKDEFLAMLSHELRNPLAPIRSAVHVLRMQERGGSENIIQKQAHEIIERQVGNVTKLVNDLLELSRFTSGRIRLTTEVIDLNQVVEHAMETVKPLLMQRKHEVVFNRCEVPVWTTADATRMEEVFVNLLNNAAKYTPDGGRIDLWCEHPDGRDYVQIRVRDNGVGIDAKLLPYIFDLFTQADRTLDRSAGGLGVGLSLAQRIVRLHGGTIEAHSPPADNPTARGSEFIVKLPSAAAPLGFAPPQPEALPGKAAGRDGLRVLVVDDNIDLVTMLASSLRERGYSVQSAYTGPDGLRVAEQWRPDIVLLDIGLPGLDGYEVARRLRADPAKGAKDLRLIALTGYGRDADIAKAHEAGFEAHLIKPYDFDELEKLMIPGR